MNEKDTVEYAIKALVESLEHSTKMRDLYFELYRNRAKIVDTVKSRLDHFMNSAIKFEMGTVEYTTQASIRTTMLKEHAKETKKLSEDYEAAVRYADHVGLVNDEIVKLKALGSLDSTLKSSSKSLTKKNYENDYDTLFTPPSIKTGGNKGGESN